MSPFFRPLQARLRDSTIRQMIKHESTTNLNFSLSHDPFGRLVLIDNQGQRHVGIEPVRAFPITNPENWITLCDTEGRELATVESLDKLAPPERQVLEHELSRREFMPRISRIARVSTLSEPSEWDVETDRGITTFTLNSEDDVRRLGPHQALIIDAHGIRYLISDTHRLDSYGRRILERYL